MPSSYSLTGAWQLALTTLSALTWTQTTYQALLGAVHSTAVTSADAKLLLLEDSYLGTSKS